MSEKELNQYLAADVGEGEQQAQEIALLRAELRAALGPVRRWEEDLATACGIDPQDPVVMVKEMVVDRDSWKDRAEKAEAKVARGLDVLARHEPNTGDEAELMADLRAALKGQ